MHRRFVALVVAFAFLLAPSAASVAFGQEATPVPGGLDRTNVRFVLPFGPDGLLPDLRVAGEVRGTCGEQSLALFDRGDAWFCNEAETGAIHDPCFENPFQPIDEPERLACMASPDAGEVILLTATEPLQRDKDAEPPPPAPAAPDAGIEPGGPAGGGQAGAPPMPPPPPPVANEAAAALSGLDLPWALDLANGKRCGLLTGATAALAGMRINYGCADGGFVIGEVDRSQPVWVVNYYDEGTLATELVAVETVWT